MEENIMRKNRRIAALLTAGLLALTPCVSAGMNVFAADHSLTVVDTDKIKHTYNAYQIITGTLGSDGSLSDMHWGDGVDNAKLIAALNTNKTILGLEDDLAATATVNDVAAVLAKITDAAKVQKLAKVFNDTGVLNADNKKALTKDGNNYTNTALADGWYLVCDESTPLGTENDSNVKVRSANLLQIVGNTTINTKHSLPTLDKVIVDGENEVDANSASIGEVVTYRLKTKVPDITGYDKYFFVVNDTLSKGLTYNDSLSVKVKGTTLTLDEDGPATEKTGNYYVAASDYNETTGTEIKIVFENVVDLFKDYKAGDDIVLEYKAILNDKAVITDAGNPNTASLTYSNDPNEDAEGTPAEGENPPKPDEPGPNDGDVTGKTPDDIVKTYTTAIKLKKVDNHGTKLTGAMFRITGEGVNQVVVAGDIFVEDATGTYYKLTDGTYTTTAPTTDTNSKYADTEKLYKKVNKSTITKDTANEVNVEAFVDENGIVTFTGLGNGEYTIKEIIVPDGYTGAADVTINISSTPDLTKANWVVVKDGDTENPLTANADNMYEFNVVNVQFSTLPSTGGVGTKLFYLFGGMLAVGSGVVLVTKKRMSYEK